MDTDVEKQIIGVRLPAKLKIMLQELEDSGKYMDRSDIMRTALRLLYKQEKQT
ncbi:MAG: ribbon-helix-helix protein, CopG family [Candidatus Heimdallarchaeaceae archaeon]